MNIFGHRGSFGFLQSAKQQNCVRAISLEICPFSPTESLYPPIRAYGTNTLQTLSIHSPPLAEAVTANRVDAARITDNANFFSLVTFYDICLIRGLFNVKNR